MKVNELKIGNYVKFYDPINGTNIYKVYNIDDRGSVSRVSLEDKGQLASCTVKDIEPIELTEDVLLKIGFKKERQLISILFYLDYEIDVDNIIRVKYIIYPNRSSLPLLKITTSRYENYECFEFMKRGVKYLHELQNSYYCLTNQELEIKL